MSRDRTSSLYLKIENFMPLIFLDRFRLVLTVVACRGPKEEVGVEKLDRTSVLNKTEYIYIYIYIYIYKSVIHIFFFF